MSSPDIDKEPGYRVRQLISSLDAGDTLPEADIVSNIIDKLDRNLRTASCILQYINSCHEPNESDTAHFLEALAHKQSPTLKSALELLKKLYIFLKNAESGIIDDTYDGDDDEDVTVKKKRKKNIGIKKKASHSIKLSGDKNGSKADKLQFIVRDVIFYIGRSNVQLLFDIIQSWGKVCCISFK